MSRLCFNPKYEEKFFWSFEEILDYYVGDHDSQVYLYDNNDILNCLNEMIGDGYHTTLATITQGNISWKNTNIRSLMDLLARRFIKKICYSSDSSTFKDVEAKEFMARLFYVCEMTAPKYEKLLELYASKASALLDPVKVETNAKNRFNDTPQNNGTYEEDPFTTNITFLDSISQNEVDTIMGRLREIESSYKNLLLDWSNEFESLFLEEDNI